MLITDVKVRDHCHFTGNMETGQMTPYFSFTLSTLFATSFSCGPPLVHSGL